MKRLHIHIGVEDISTSIKFYNALFGAEPTKVKDDYAKWMLEDPKVNFAISLSSNKGVDHLGIQVDDASELEDMRSQMLDANIETHGDGEGVCCYAKSEKSWVEDPSGVAWEAYHTMEDAEIFSKNADIAENSCCVPDNTNKSSGCCD